MIFGNDVLLYCDFYGGNFVICRNDLWCGGFGGGFNFEIILYDYGLYCDIFVFLCWLYVKMWFVVIDGDMECMKKYVYDVVGIIDEDFFFFVFVIIG